MAKTMQERKKERIVKAIAKDVYGRGWIFQGTEVGTFNSYDVGGVYVYARFTWSGFAVKSYVDGEQCGAEDCVRMFVGENAMSEAIEWTADRIISIREEAARRAAPYAAGHEKYLRAMKGEVR